MYIQDLACKTHRGMMGQVERGYAAGAAPYGYCNEKVKGGSEIHIVPEEAAIVNRIFSEYVSGISPHNIAASLNRDGIPSPRNSSWHVSAIAGSQNDYVYSEASDVLKKLVSDENRDQNSVNRRLAELDGSIERLVDAISQLGSSESLIERLKKAESEKTELLKQSEVNTELLVLPTKKEIQKIFDAKVYGLNEVLTNNVELARASLSEVLGDIPESVG